MPKPFDRRLLKAIRRKVTAPLKRHLVNKREKVLQPAQDDKPSVTLATHVPVPQTSPDFYEKQAAEVEECGPTIRDPKRASGIHDFVVDGGDQDHVPSTDAGVAADRQSLHNKKDKPQQASVAQDSQHQHRSTATPSDIHRERPSSANTTLDVSQTPRATSDRTSMAVADNPVERHEVSGYAPSGPLPPLRNEQLLTMQSRLLRKVEQRNSVGKALDRTGFDRPCSKGNVMSRDHKLMTERTQIQQNVQASSHARVLRREQDTQFTCAAAVGGGHNRKCDIVARVPAQVCDDSHHRGGTGIQPSYMQKAAVHKPQRHIGRLTKDMSEPNTIAIQMQNTVMGVAVEQPGSYGRRRVRAQLGRPAKDLAKSQSPCVLAPDSMMSVTEGSQGPQLQTVAPGKPSSTTYNLSRTGSIGLPQETRMTIVPVDSFQQHRLSRAGTLTDHSVDPLKTPSAPRRQLRLGLATTRASPTIGKTQKLICSALIKEAYGYHARVCQVRGVAESYARAFGLEVASSLYEYVVMQCTFDAAHATLMVSLCAIVSVTDPVSEQACEDGDPNKHLIPIEPNEPLPNGIQMQAGFGDGGRHFGGHSWIDISKVYQVPVEFIKASRDVSLKLCKSSWQKMREKLSMGT
ncbi:hypothetical protein A1O7_07544 [Cladophialophora yegresii CBS 114405]|uniref:Uncharacterized protein n=1 Tax=Cladophialophora yegresii CBS 114405 TaxID=1182544 RepID=W9VNA7_9EURO|nr:uncharacterized protein A1O7_07544 [Cladophialophora yegresii CBS 114405]EXJ57197.1 hypothetical protein A1O7_07544 [Cladophialophora yegresii CBS 114405]